MDRQEQLVLLRADSRPISRILAKMKKLKQLMAHFGKLAELRCSELGTLA
jgi:hypothetical protein